MAGPLDGAVRATYGDRLISIVVFGSVARGAPRAESDVDLLNVGDPLPRGRMARVAEFDPVLAVVDPHIARLRTEGIHTDVSPVFKTPDEVRAGSPLFPDMTLHADDRFDRGGFFAGHLAGLRARTEALGSRRIEKHGGTCWLLKPDLRPSEVFEL